MKQGTPYNMSEWVLTLPVRSLDTSSHAMDLLMVLFTKTLTEGINTIKEQNT